MANLLISRGLIFLTLFYFGDAWAAPPYLMKECGQYLGKGVLECEASLNCELVLLPKSQAEFRLKINQTLKTLLPYQGKWVQASFETLSLNPGSVVQLDLDSVRRVLPDFSLKAIQLKRSKKCKN